MSEAPGNFGRTVYRALSEEAVRLRVDNGISVVAGACPMISLEAVGCGHRIHRRLRYRNGSLAGHA